MAVGDKPVQVFKHRGISAGVFENSIVKDGKKQIFYKVSLRRTFKQNDEFISNANFSRDEIPIARLLLERAWQWMIDSEKNGSAPELDDNPFDEPPKRKSKDRS